MPARLYTKAPRGWELNVTRLKDSEAKFSADLRKYEPSSRAVYRPTQKTIQKQKARISLAPISILQDRD